MEAVTAALALKQAMNKAWEQTGQQQANTNMLQVAAAGHAGLKLAAADLAYSYLAHTRHRLNGGLLASLPRSSACCALPWRTCRYTPVQVAAGVGVAATLAAGGVAAASDPDIAEALSAPVEHVWEQLEGVFPPLQSHPKLVLGGLGLAALGGAYMWRWVGCSHVAFVHLLHIFLCVCLFLCKLAHMLALGVHKTSWDGVGW